MKVAKTLVVVACAGLLSASLFGSASFARAQDQGSAGDGGGHSAASVATQPDKAPPIDVAGCWDGSSTVGTLEDNSFGSGYGWIGIIQNGKNIKSGAHAAASTSLFGTVAMTGRMGPSKGRRVQADSRRWARSKASAK